MFRTVHCICKDGLQIRVLGIDREIWMNSDMRSVLAKHLGAERMKRAQEQPSFLAGTRSLLASAFRRQPYW